MATRARERLLDTAEELFYADGIRAVGLERILTTSGVGRASFYRHFASKDELVVAVLRRRDERWREWLTERVTALGGHPLAVFDALAERFARADFRGCAFINTMIETADPESPAHQVAAEHKAKVTAYVEGLLRDHGAGDPATTAPQFVLLMDGATVTALRERTTAPATQARTLARSLVT
ncbi:MAG: TetR/AcrR family transcriptional regulator [Hamadaea sp.]|uniref:TetR/AcrR family transcriptional regulator n=1 Tax=Hamadaea sp. TaxID=2024425 RepID=UPI00183D79FB|nr:TetR/AcrR family transcriptional regulator [Hamadaea sp.]NUR71534.1 TetR/AcrR family transcriptional regulator [Hamadaea sp.]NUT19666.1 TetR/AcrR family transcriptional regulator [Hamadaea sp.]